MRCLRPSMILLLAMVATAGSAAAQKAPATAPKPAAAKPAKPPAGAPKPVKGAKPPPAATASATAAATAAPTATAAASADALNAPVDTDVTMSDKAKELFKEGTKHYRAQKWADAEAAFEAAWALTDQKSKGLVNNLGQTKMHLGKYREAAAYLTIARRLASPGDKQLTDIENDLALAKTKVGTLTITVSVDDAQVMLGDKPLGKAPLADPVFVDPGHMSVHAFREGYDAAKVELDVTAGQEVPVTLTLERPKPPPPPTPTVTATAPPPPETKRGIMPAVALGGAGVLSLILGGVFVGVADSQASDVRSKAPKDTNGNPLCGDSPAPGAAPGLCDDLRATASSAISLQGAGIAFFVIGTVALAGGVGYWVWAGRPMPASKPAMVLTPMVGDKGGGLHLTGSF